MIPGLRPAFFVLVVVAAALGETSGHSAAHLEQRTPSNGQRTSRELRGEDGLVRAYDFILEGRFDQVDAELRRACGPAPIEACHVLDATALWWHILLDPTNPALDPAFSASVDRAIRATEAWTERAPTDPEAWFYLGGAYAARVQWRVLRGEKLSAARDGKRIKQALEQALELDPLLEDAHFGIGLYKYYADVAPAAAKFLRFLLLLPGGDRDEGLAEMLRARSRGRLLQGEADYQLHVIYLWYERQPDRALELLRGLKSRYPANPLFTILLAEILDAYKHDITASLETWRSLLASTKDPGTTNVAVAEVQARLGMARMLDALYQTDQSIEHLQTLVSMKPKAPYASLALAHLRLGEAHDRLGSRAAAVAAYRAAHAAAPADDLLEIRESATNRLRRAPDARKAEAYALSLQGWRRFERNDLPGATAALEKSISYDPQDPVARYRMGRLLQSRKDDAAALVQFQAAIRNAKACPAPILGNVYLEAARIHERAARRDEAISFYKIASTLFGASAETRATASRALTRLSSR
jgi:tetratricopeptide (TPR) repeat protein